MNQPQTSRWELTLQAFNAWNCGIAEITNSEQDFELRILNLCMRPDRTIKPGICSTNGLENGDWRQRPRLRFALPEMRQCSQHCGELIARRNGIHNVQQDHNSSNAT